MIWIMGRDKKPSGPFKICWYFIGFWDLQIDLGWVQCCCKVFVHIAFFFLFLCNEWTLLRLCFQLAKQYSAIVKMSLFVNWGHVFNLVSFSFLPLPMFLFICRNGKKKREICTTDLKHLDVFYSKRCYIPAIYNLSK